MTRLNRFHHYYGKYTWARSHSVVDCIYRFLGVIKKSAKMLGLCTTWAIRKLRSSWCELRSSLPFLSSESFALLGLQFRHVYHRKTNERTKCAKHKRWASWSDTSLLVECLRLFIVLFFSNTHNTCTHIYLINGYTCARLTTYSLATWLLGNWLSSSIEISYCILLVTWLLETDFQERTIIARINSD